MAVRQWLARGLMLGGLVVLIGIPVHAADDPVEARLRKDITYLASNECEGRGVATKGVHLAADYIAAEFKKAGLKPAGPNDSYFQPFTITGGTLEAAPHLVLRGPQGQQIELKPGEHFEVLGLSHSGQIQDAPVVFAGYGITYTKEKDGVKQTVYDDYQDLDVAGKVVVVLRDAPRGGNRETAIGLDRRRHAPLASKMSNAGEHKAAAILFVNDRATADDGDHLLHFSMTATDRSPAKLPALHVRRAVVDQMLQSSLGTNLPDCERDLDRDLKPRSATLIGWTVSLETSVRRTIDAKNVVGVLEGSGPLAKETVVVGAHYDHWGYGGSGSMAGMKKPAIHHGADDNASGTTALIELARRFGQMPKREGRRIVFMAFSGEEIALLGSAHYCKNPLFPLADTVAMVNLDMVGRMSKDAETNKDKLVIEGAGTAKDFNELIDRINKKYDFKISKVAGGSGPSDQASFYAKEIPVIFFFTGSHPDYHRPSDTADRINIPGMRRVTDMAEEFTTHFTTVPERPQYVKVAGSGRTGDVPRIGIMPSYDDDKDGVLLGGVSKGGPAEKAGMKEGDRIVEVAGKPVKNLEGYMALIRATKRGEAVELGVIRDGKKMAIKVVPE